MAMPIILGAAERSPNGDEIEILTKCTDIGEGVKVLPVGVGAVFTPPPLQAAFERATLRGWYVLFDVENVAMAGPRGAAMMMRIFRLTPAGEARLSKLRVSAT